MVHPISCHLSLWIPGTHLHVIQTAEDLKEQTQNTNFCAVTLDIFVCSMDTLWYPISSWTLLYSSDAQF